MTAMWQAAVAGCVGAGFVGGTKEELMVSRARAGAGETGCFAAGTLVHTKEGLKPIETIQVGDWVLSQPDETGAIAYKQVHRTLQHEEKSVFRVNFNVIGSQVEYALVVTGNHPFYVADSDKSCFPEDYWDELPARTGWRRADRLGYGALLQLPDGSTARVSSVDAIWRTSQPGKGWVDAGRDAETGWLVNVNDGKAKLEPDTQGSNEFMGVGSFNFRYDAEELAEEWACKTTVYNVEVADFHTYYVGELGVWVHNDNCCKYSHKQFLLDGKMTSPERAELMVGDDMLTLLEQLDREGVCFAAGTIVHGKDGQVPIEQLQAGDWVLTQPEETGERTIKRVVKTMRYENRAVFRVSYTVVSDPATLHMLLVTGEHPFFVKGHDEEELRATGNRPRPVGWIQAKDVGYGALLDLADGQTGWLTAVEPVWRTPQEGIGYIARRERDSGEIVDLRNGKIVNIGGFREICGYAAVDDFNMRFETEECADKWAYKTTVYNFEVEDCHTYYVGAPGVWVHNECL